MKSVGRPRSANPSVRISVRINSADAQWLSLWADTPTLQIQDLINRARLFWPSGPRRFR